MLEAFFIGLAGAAGALGRYGVGRWAKEHVGAGFPFGTFAVNVLGSLLLGLVLGAGLQGALSERAKLALGTGFCGALTTFSTFSVESVRLLEEGRWARGLGYVGLSLALGLAAAALGLWLAQRLFSQA